MAPFTGIPVAALDFYEDLEADNSKVWWAAHKHIYDEQVRVPALALLEALEPEFGTAKVFRPYRDVRFSKDKSPYKTHLGGFVQTAPGVGYYLQIGAPGMFVAGGYYAQTPQQVARLRAAIDNEVRGDELQRLLDSLTATKFTVGGDRLKTHPRGYPPDHPRIELLRHKSLTAGREFGCPAWLETPRCKTEVAKAWRAMTPLVEWLSQVVGEPG